MPLHFGAWEALGCHGLPWDALRLLMEEVKFEKGDDQKKVDTMVKRVIQMFMEAIYGAPGIRGSNSVAAIVQNQLVL